MTNHLKEKLKANKPVLGISATFMQPESIRAISNSGFDWIFYDMEHGPWCIETVNNMIQTTAGSKASPIIRVVWNDMNEIKKALDTGTRGIIVPWVSSKEMAEKAVRYSRYPPKGLRGWGPGRAAKAWGISWKEYTDIANDDLFIAVQIEREEAIENLEEIVSVDGVDATWLGPGDLSASMGLKGQYFHPKVTKAMERMIEVCIDAGVAPGIAAREGVVKYGVKYINKLIDEGFRFINVGTDINLLKFGCEDFIGEINL